MENKKGVYGKIFTFLIMAFVITVFFGIWYYASTQLNTVLSTVHFDIGTTNFTNIVNSTWGEVYSSYSQLKTLAYVFIFGMMLTIFVSAWMVRRPAIFLILWVVTSIGAVIVAAYLSNAYQLLLVNPDFGATLQSFTGASYMLLYLPYIAAVVCLFSGLISLIGFNRGASEQIVM